MRYPITAGEAILETLGNSEQTFNQIESGVTTPHKRRGLRSGMHDLLTQGLVEKVWRGSVHEPMYRRKR